MSTLGRNIIHNLWGQGVVMLVSLVAVSFVFKRLGADALGIIYFVSTLNGGLCGAFEMGLCNTTVCKVAAHLREEPAYVHALIRSASLFYWAIYAVLALAVWFGAPALVGHWIHLVNIRPADAVRAIRVLGITGLLGLPRAFYTSLFRGLQRMELNNAIDGVTAVIQQLGTIVAIMAGAQLNGVVNWLAASFILGIVAYLVLATRLFPVPVLIPGYSPAAIRRSLRFSLNMATISFLSVIHVEADKVIISRLMPVGALGYYGVASRLVKSVNALTGAVSTAAFPALSANIGEDRAATMDQYRDLHDLICLGTVPVLAAVVFAAVPLFSLLFDKRIADTLFVPVVFLSVGHYMHGTLNIPYFFSLADGKPEIAVRQNVVALVVSLPAAVWLTSSYGLAGAAFSWVIYHLTVYLYAVPKLCRECLGLSSSEWFQHIAKIMLLAFITYGGAWLFLGLVTTRSILPLTFAYVGASTAFVLLVYRLQMADELIAVLRRLTVHLRAAAVGN